MSAPEPKAAAEPAAVRRARELAGSGLVEAALTLLRQHLDTQADDVAAHELAAACCTRLGRSDQAVLHLSAVSELFAMSGHLLRAIAAMQQILAITPGHTATQKRLAELYALRDSQPPPIRTSSAPQRTAVSAPPVSTDRVNAVRRAPIFSELHPDDFRAFVNKLGRRVYRAGEVVIEEGTHGRAMFAIARGRVSVQRRRQSQNEEVAQMGEGEFFGEMALVANVPRLASVRALEECELLELTAANLDDLCSLAPQIRDVLVRFYKERLLENLLRSTEILRLMPRRSQHVLLDLLELRTAPAGVRLLEQGRDGAGIFVILRGQCQASHRDEKGSVTPYPLMQEGELFGELSHLQQAPVSADVTTLTPCVLLVLPPRFIDDVLLAEPDVRAKIYEVAGQRARRTRDLLSQLAVERGLI